MTANPIMVARRMDTSVVLEKDPFVGAAVVASLAFSVLKLGELDGRDVVPDWTEEGSDVSALGAVGLLPTGADGVPEDGIISPCGDDDVLSEEGIIFPGGVGVIPVVGVITSPAGKGEDEDSTIGALDPEGSIMGIPEFEIEGKSAVVGAIGEKDPQLLLHSKMDARQAPYALPSFSQAVQHVRTSQMIAIESHPLNSLADVTLSQEPSHEGDVLAKQPYHPSVST